MRDRILALGDSRAFALLQALADARQSEGGVERDCSPEVLLALEDRFGESSGAPRAVVLGDLARSALLLASEDPAQHDRIERLMESSALDRYVPVEIALLGTAILVVLQTHVRFERDTKGRSKLRIEKKPLAESILAQVARGLVELVRGNAKG